MGVISFARNLAKGIISIIMLGETSFHRNFVSERVRLSAQVENGCSLVVPPAKRL